MKVILNGIYTDITSIYSISEIIEPNLGYYPYFCEKGRVHIKYPNHIDHHPSGFTICFVSGLTRDITNFDIEKLRKLHKELLNLWIRNKGDFLRLDFDWQFKEELYNGILKEQNRKAS